MKIQLVVLAAVLAVAGCGLSPTPPSPGNTTGAAQPAAAVPAAAVPATLTAIGAAVTVPSDDSSGGTATMRIVSAKWKTTFSAMDPAPAAGAALLLDVEYTGKSGATSLNPFDFSAKDPAGHSYSPGIYIGTTSTALNHGTIAVGEKARGIVEFNAPHGPLTVKLGQAFGDTVAATWMIPA